MRHRTGHDLFPGQRTKAFHTALLQGFAIVTNFMTVGSKKLDFFLLEPEAGTSTLARLIAKPAIDSVSGQAAKAGHSVTRVHLATQIQKISDEARPSRTFRQELAAVLRAELKPLLEGRQLKRAKTATDTELLELAAGKPSPPALPPALAEMLEGQRSPPKLPYLVPLGYEAFDRSRATLVAPTLTMEPTFENLAPDALAEAVVCTRSQLLVAPSLHVRGALGLYSARKFMQGEVICTGTSPLGGWIEAGEWHRVLPQVEEPSYTLRLTLKHHLFASRDTAVDLVGEPHRHLWANMNSTECLHTDVQANVVAVFGKEAGASDPSALDGKFVAFKAATDVLPFQELLWKYAWASDEAETAAASLPDPGASAASAPEAVWQRTMHHYKHYQPKGWSRGRARARTRRRTEKGQDETPLLS